MPRILLCRARCGPSARWALTWSCSSRFLSLLDLARLDRLQPRADAFDETHVDDLVVLDVGLENSGAPYDRTRRCPGFATDHAVLAPQLVLERAAKSSLEVLQRHGRELFLGDFGGLIPIGVKKLQALDHAADECAHKLGILLNRLETDVERGVGVRTQFLRNVEERLAPDRVPDPLRHVGLGRHADLRLLPPHGRDGGGTGGLDKRNVPFGVEVPLLQALARDRIGRAPEWPDCDRLALEVAGPSRVRWVA